MHTFYCSVIQFGHVAFILFALSDGTSTDDTGRPRTDSTFFKGLKGTTVPRTQHSIPDLFGSKVATSNDGSIQDSPSIPADGTGVKPPSDTNPMSSSETRQRFPEHTATRIGSTRQGQRVTVRKWYLSQNGKPVNGTRRTSTSYIPVNGTRRTSTSYVPIRQAGRRHSTRSGHQSPYPGRYVSRRSQIRGGVTSSRKFVPRQRSGVRTVIPRTRTASGVRITPPVYDGPVQKSRTYVYPFANLSSSHLNPPQNGTAYRGVADLEGDRKDNTGRQYLYTTNHLPETQTLGRRGVETEALSSSTDSHHQQTVTSRQPNQRQNPRSPHYPQRRHSQDPLYNFSSTSTSPYKRTSHTGASGRIYDPYKLNPPASSSVSDASQRQSYRSQTNRYRLGQRLSPHGSRVNPATRVYNPHNGNRNTSVYRGTRYSYSTRGQMGQRRNGLSSSHSRNGRYHPRTPSYPGRSSSDIFTSYSVTDEGECPDTGIDLRINGLGCQQAIQRYGQYICYAHEYTSKLCCETCLPKKRKEQAGCEYGDHARMCAYISPSDCYDRRNELSCCETCARFKKMGAPENCRWGDMIGSQRCEEVRRNPGLCYIPDNNRLCCETCSLVQNTTNPSCPWGDQNSKLCQIFGPRGDVRINCYSPYRRRLCCQSCERLKYWLPSPMPANCEYGDRPVIFNTGHYGRVTCGNILQYVHVNECRNNPVVSKNCCYTCQRFMNSTTLT